MCFVWRNIGIINIRICRDIEGKMWLGVGKMFKIFRKIKKYVLSISLLFFADFLFKAVFKLIIEHYSEMLSYITTGRINIRIHRDITGKMWFGVHQLPAYVSLRS